MEFKHGSKINFEEIYVLLMLRKVLVHNMKFFSENTQKASYPIYENSRKRLSKIDLYVKSLFYERIWLFLRGFAAW